MIGYLAVYGNQQWATLKTMDEDELSLLYHAVSRIKLAENDASKQAIEESKKNKPKPQRSGRRTR